MPQPFTEEELKKMEKSQDVGDVGLSNTVPSEEKKSSSPPPTILKVDPPSLLIQEGDLDGYEITSMDKKIANVFEGNFIRNNDGTQLDGGISDDSIWQTRFRSLVILPLQQYDLPRGPTGNLFVLLLVSENEGVIDRK